MMCTSRTVYASFISILGLILVVHSDDTCSSKGEDCGGDVSGHNTLSGVDMAQPERSFIMIKPDGVHRNLVGEIISRFEKKGFRLVAMKFVQADEEHLKKHYADLAGRPFFAGLVKYMSSGPLVPMVWEGKGVVKTGRVMLGETDPAKSLPGTIRGDYAVEVGRNICHGSDAVESAEKEIALWFKPEELQAWKPVSQPWIVE